MPKRRTSTAPSTPPPPDSSAAPSPGPWQSKWMRGLLEACVLSVLGQGPAYGYEIATRFEDAGFDRPKGGSLYPILTRLERDGAVVPTWVNGESGPSRKYYELTPAGHELAASVATDWQSFSVGISQLLNLQESRTST